MKPFRKIKLGNKFCEVPRTPADDIVACNVPIELLTALSSIQIVVQTQIYGKYFFSQTLQCNDVHYHFDVKVETFTNTQADTMSISLMNFVALQWLRKVDPALIAIVKTEY